jgi:hypothetical protein
MPGRFNSLVAKIIIFKKETRARQIVRYLFLWCPVRPVLRVCIDSQLGYSFRAFHSCDFIRATDSGIIHARQIPK